jgi:hypothetical protein
MTKPNKTAKEEFAEFMGKRVGKAYMIDWEEQNVVRAYWNWHISQLKKETEKYYRRGFNCGFEDGKYSQLKKLKKEIKKMQVDVLDLLDKFVGKGTEFSLGAVPKKNSVPSKRHRLKYGEIPEE